MKIMHTEEVMEVHTLGPLSVGADACEIALHPGRGDTVNPCIASSNL